MASKKEKSEELGLQKRQGHYSISERRQIVAMVEGGMLTARDAAAHYGISRRTVYSWIDTHAANAEAIPRTTKHSPAQRRQVALQIRAGLLSPEQAAQQNHVSLKTIGSWMAALEQSSGLPPENKGTMSKQPTDKAASIQIRDLQLQIEALQTMIDLAEEQLGIDIRKNSGTKQQ